MSFDAAYPPSGGAGYTSAEPAQYGDTGTYGPRSGYGIDPGIGVGASLSKEWNMRKLGPRVSLQVSYLTSGQYSSHGVALHFFQVSEGGNKPRKQKRLLVLADRATFLADFESQMNRCMLVSRIEEMGLFEEHLRPLMGPMSQYDLALQNTTTVDFIRMVPCVFSTRDATQAVCMYELEENQPLAKKVNCKPAMLQKHDGSVTKEQHEEVLKTMRRTNQIEVQKLRDMLQKQKDEQLMELIDARTQIEQLRHSLSLLESERFLQNQGQVPFHPVKDEQPPPTEAPSASVGPQRRLPPPPREREREDDGYDRGDDVYRRGRRDGERERERDYRDYDRPQDRDRDYRTDRDRDGGPVRRSGSPTTVNIYTSASNPANVRNRAGELVDNLSRELEANARYLDQLQARENTRDRPRERDRRSDRDYDREYPRERDLSPPAHRSRYGGRERERDRTTEREYEGRRTPGRRSSGRARTPRSGGKAIGSPPQSSRMPGTPPSTRGSRRAGWR